MATFLSNRPTLAASLGTGLGQGLEALANQKLQQIQQRNLAQNLQQLVPDKQQATALSQLPENLQQIALKDLLAAPGREAYAQALGGQVNPSAQFNERQATNIAKMNQKERQIHSNELREARQYLTPFEESYSKGRELLRENKELKEIARSGKLRAGTHQQILDKLGLGTFWQPLSNELASKNLAAQAQNAAAAFNTSRLTNLDVNLFKQSLGTLWNTPQGIYAVASINNLQQKAKDAVHKERRDIIKENNGRIPYDIEQQAEERAQPLLAKYAAKSMEIVTNAAAKFDKTYRKVFNTIQDVTNSGLNMGDIVTDNETGQKYEWNGSKLVKKG